MPAIRACTSQMGTICRYAPTLKISSVAAARSATARYWASSADSSGQLMVRAGCHPRSASTGWARSTKAAIQLVHERRATTPSAAKAKRSRASGIRCKAVRSTGKSVPHSRCISVRPATSAASNMATPTSGMRSASLLPFTSAHTTSMKASNTGTSNNQRAAGASVPSSGRVSEASVPSTQPESLP